MADIPRLRFAISRVTAKTDRFRADGTRFAGSLIFRFLTGMGRLNPPFFPVYRGSRGRLSSCWWAPKGIYRTGTTVGRRVGFHTNTAFVRSGKTFRVRRHTQYARIKTARARRTSCRGGGGDADNERQTTTTAAARTRARPPRIATTRSAAAGTRRRESRGPRDRARRLFVWRRRRPCVDVQKGRVASGGGGGGGGGWPCRTGRRACNRRPPRRTYGRRSSTRRTGSRPARVVRHAHVRLARAHTHTHTTAPTSTSGPRRHTRFL